MTEEYDPNTTVRISNEMHARLKAMADEQGRTIKTVAEMAITLLEQETQKGKGE